MFVSFGTEILNGRVAHDCGSFLAESCSKLVLFVLFHIYQTN